ncbi:MAG: asparagine synthase (glutamine-hydrolyzing) [Steroidobacteraceae bacterium]
MCGIFAAATRHGVAPDRISAALKVLNHRGPDGLGTWTSDDRRWTLGHTRLSIIGLNNGDQPIASPDNTVHVVVNGEFYGYRAIRDQLRAAGCRFATESDSEIALHLYQQRGMQAMRQLRGEFAIVIANERERVIIAVRDRFGIKPLYYSVVNGEVFFASEIKALLALGVPAKWNVEGVYGSLGQSHEVTQFAGISTVPPGCYAIVKDGDVRIYPYWDLEFPTAGQMKRDAPRDEQVVQDFRSVLKDAVRERLVADVEVACYLSGGIDSCAVLGLAQQEMSRPIRAFTLTFDNPLHNEAAIAQAQAKHVGASFHPIPITGREIADAYADAIWHAETPMFNGHGVAKYLLSRAVRDAGIKVVFTGEGADEMLGGYPYYRVDAVNNNPALSQGEKAALIDQMFGTNQATRALLMPERLSNPTMDSLERRLGWIPASLNLIATNINLMAQFFRDDQLIKLHELNPIAAAMDRLPLAMRIEGRDHLNQMLYFCAKTILPNFILNYLGDRMEMAHSVEGRVPFLDHLVAEAAARVPVDMKVKGIREKHVLREATRDVLIPEVYNRQKHPFTSPPIRAKSDPMMGFYRDTFESQAARDQPIYDMKKAKAALEQLLTSPDDQRIAAEAVVQRIASVIVMQERFAMT